MSGGSNTSSYRVTAIFPSHLYLTHRHTTTIYDTVSFRFEHTLRWMTHNLSLLLDTSSHHARTIITTSRSGSNTRSYRLTYFRMSSAILDTSPHNLYSYASMMLEHSVPCSPSCHVIGYAALPYFTHHPYLIHRSTTTTTSKSPYGSNTL
jgi:hypothetical protein